MLDAWRQPNLAGFEKVQKKARWKIAGRRDPHVGAWPEAEMLQAQLWS